MIEGEKGNLGKKTIKNWFNIKKNKKSRDFYNFLYCPSICKTYKVMCKDIEIFVEDGK